MRAKIQRKWSFVRPSRPAIWRWFEAAGVIVVSHALLILLIGVKPEETRNENSSSAGAILLSERTLPSSEAVRMRRWMELHDPASVASPWHSAGVKGIVPDVLHHEVGGGETAFSSIAPLRKESAPAVLPVNALGPAPAMPLGEVEAPPPFRAKIQDSDGKEVRIALAVDHGTSNVTRPTVLRIVRQQEDPALAVIEISCGEPQLDRLAQGGILRSCPDAADGALFTVNWPAERGGEK